MVFPRLLPLALVLTLLHAPAQPAAAQDLFVPTTPKTDTSASEMLQNLLLGKLKDQQPKPPAPGVTTTTTTTTLSGGTTSSSGSSAATTRLPRKAAGTGKAGSAQADATPDAAAAKPARTIRPRPQRDADFPSLPRLKPMAPISASPTIQLPQPIPMPIQ